VQPSNHDSTADSKPTAKSQPAVKRSERRRAARAEKRRRRKLFRRIAAPTCQFVDLWVTDRLYAMAIGGLHR